MQVHIRRRCIQLFFFPQCRRVWLFTVVVSGRLKLEIYYYCQYIIIIVCCSTEVVVGLVSDTLDSFAFFIV